MAEGEQELGKTADAVFTIPDVHPLLSPILFTIPLQLLAYHIAVLRGEDGSTMAKPREECDGGVAEG
ncbi:MAG: hypothetical protein U0361_21595 [Nitrospiraceae bacterium]